MDKWSSRFCWRIRHALQRLQNKSYKKGKEQMLSDLQEETKEDSLLVQRMKHAVTHRMLTNKIYGSVAPK